MDSFEFNKIAMSVLGTVFFLLAVSLLSESIFHAEAPENPGYVIEVAEGGTDDAPEDTGPAFDPVTPLLMTADAAEGEKVARKCASCHNFEEGGANKVGPGLWNVVNANIGVHEGFSYSSALLEYGEGKQWTYEALNGFLWKPKTYIKGTSMGFAGLKKVEERADLIAYLRSLSSDPAPLPSAEDAAAATEETEAATE